MAGGQRQDDKFKKENEQQPSDISEKGGVAEGSIDQTDMEDTDESSISGTKDR